MSFKLSAEHQAVAQSILQKNITKRYRKKGCNRCNMEGFQAYTLEDLLVPCQCVNVPPARKEWEEYCEQHTELKYLLIKK